MKRLLQAVVAAGALLPSMAHAQDAAAQAPAPAPTAALGTTQADTTVETTVPATTITETPAEGAAASTTNVATAPVRAEPPPLPWRGSVFVFDQSTNTSTLAPASELTYSPSYQIWMSLRPRWAITRNLSFRVRQDLTIGALPGDRDTGVASFGDLWTELYYSGVPKFAGIQFTFGGRLQFPVSRVSQFRTVVVSPALVANFSRAFAFGQHGGELSLGIGGVASAPIYRYTTPGGVASYPCASTDFQTVTDCYTGNGGPSNTAVALQALFTLGYETPVHGLSLNVMYLLSNSFKYRTAPGVVMDQQGGTVVVDRAADDTRRASSSWWLASVDYEPAKWLSLSVGYYVFRPVLDPSGVYGNPFYSPSNTRVFLTATIPLDEVYSAIAHRYEADDNIRAPSRVTMNGEPSHRNRANEAAVAARQAAVINGTFF